jgi:predicted secreted protein
VIEVQRRMPGKEQTMRYGAIGFVIGCLMLVGLLAACQPSAAPTAATAEPPPAEEAAAEEAPAEEAATPTAAPSEPATATVEAGTTTTETVDTSATTTETVEGAPTEGEVTSTTIVLPNGDECLFSGTGATLAFDGQRVNYQCGTADTVVLGDPQLDEVGGISLVTGVISQTAEGFTLTNSAQVTGTILAAELADGTACLNAGQGATIGIDDKRMNFTCGETSEGQTIGLVGPFIQGDPGLWMADWVVVEQTDDGFAAAEEETMAVARMIVASSSLVADGSSNGQTINLAQGQTLVLRLEGNPTTGFTWQVDEVDEAVLKPEGEPLFQQSGGGLGAGGVQVLFFAAVAPGETPLRLIYSRPFEENVEPAETFEATVAVE